MLFQIKKIYWIAISNSDDKIHSTLYVKDKFSISDQAFHELSLLASDLPKSYQVKKVAQALNSEFEINLLQAKF